MNESTNILRDTNNYLRSEIEARWPLRYKTKRCGVWVINLPNDTLGTLYLNVYSNGGLNPGFPMLRLRTGINDYNLSREIMEKLRRNPMRPFEFTFSCTRATVVIPWILDNMLEIKEKPEWLVERFAHNMEVGAPLHNYHWDEVSWVLYQAKCDKEKAYEERRKALRDERRLAAGATK